MLPTIDMSEPMQEAIPAFVIGSDLAQVWSCGTTLPMTSAGLADAFRSFVLGRATLRADQHVHLLFPQYEVRCANRADSSTQCQRYHVLSAAALNSSRNRNFVHMKGESQRRRPRLPGRRRCPRFGLHRQFGCGEPQPSLPERLLEPHLCAGLVGNDAKTVMLDRMHHWLFLLEGTAR